MYADSLLQDVRLVERQGNRLLKLRAFSGPEPRCRVDVTMISLLDLAEQLRASAPLPLQENQAEPMCIETGDCPNGGHHKHAEADPLNKNGLVSRLIETSYEHGPPMVDRLDPETVNRIETANRIETVDSQVVVPLSASAPYAQNWQPVLAVVLSRLEAALKDFRRLSRRARSDATDRLLATGLEGIVDMLEVFLLVIRRANAESRYVNSRTDHHQDELLSKVADATTQLRSDENA